MLSKISTEGEDKLLRLENMPIMCKTMIPLHRLTTKHVLEDNYSLDKMEYRVVIVQLHLKKHRIFRNTLVPSAIKSLEIHGF